MSSTYRQTTAPTEPFCARLVDCILIKGRGAALVLSEYFDGRISMGNKIRVGDRVLIVNAVEMIDLRTEADGIAGRVALLVDADQFEFVVSHRGELILRE